jgi:Mg-chelatase subunit ChlD
MLRSNARQAVPTSEPQELARATRRTLLVRGALALALVAALALVVLEARSEDVRQSPLVPSGKTGIMVLDISASTSGAPFAQTIAKLVEADERVGLVAFSDAGYELIPPGTSGRALVPFLRYFADGEDGQAPPARNPWDDFRAGTKISEGLRVAREVLERERIQDGSILLLSDFEILPDEIPRVAEQVAFLQTAGADVRLIPLDPTPERRARMNAILGGAAVLRDEAADAPVRAPESGSAATLAPWLFLAFAGLLVALLAVNEGVLARMEVRR